MEPTGTTDLIRVRQQLAQQKQECLQLLDTLDQGVGRLVTVTMTVNQPGKIDLNQWCGFIAQHAKRHLDQLESIEREFFKQ